MPISAVFEDPTGRFAAQSDLMVKNVLAAYGMWSPFLAEPASDIAIRFYLKAPYGGRGAGSSTAMVAIGSDGERTIAEQGATYELRTGNDPNGSVSDIDIYFDADYVASKAWINPFDGSVCPPNRFDLVQALAHEIGHGLAFNGYRAWSDGQLKGAYETTFDRYVTVVDGRPYFVGPQAIAVYGGPVPLTEGNLFHLASKTGTDKALAADLMNGVGWAFGSPYVVSALDIAILSDCGVPTILGERLDGTAHNDRINAGGGDDKVFGLGGADILHGDAGSDLIYADDGNDLAFGDDGDDQIHGGGGSDVLFGGAGNDLLFGELGDDVLTGGAGADIFIFEGLGLDRITDFRPDEGDRIALGAASRFSVLSIGEDTIIRFDGGASVVLAGVHHDSLTDGWLLMI